MTEYVHPEVLVDTEWVAAHTNDPTVRLVESDEDVLLYEVGHVPPDGLAPCRLGQSPWRQQGAERCHNAHDEEGRGRVGARNSTLTCVMPVRTIPNWRAAA